MSSVHLIKYNMWQTSANITYLKKQEIYVKKICVVKLNISLYKIVIISKNHITFL